MNAFEQSLILILFGHWVGDYLLQGNTVAELKSTSLGWLSFHVLLYTLVIFVFSLYFFSWMDAIKFSLLNGVLHFFTDLVTSRLASKYKSNPRIFYPIIGFDQLIHTVTLIVTIHFINS